MTHPNPHSPERLPSRAPPGSLGGEGRARPPNPFFAGAVVLALAGLVAAASGGSPVWMSLGDEQASRSEMLANVADLVILGIIAGSAVTFIFHYAVIARSAGVPPLRTTLLRALPIFAVAIVALALLAIARADREPGAVSSTGALQLDWFPGLGLANDPQASAEAAGAGESRSDANSGSETDPNVLGPILLVLVGLLAAAILGAAVWWWSRSWSVRREYPDEEGVGVSEFAQEAGGAALLGTIEAMLADPDPRAAIIGAYASLLEGLAACGLGRQDHEAPMEHLHRALTILHVRPEPMRQLIRLFEIARFSTHPLTSSHRAQALDALRAAATDVAGASPASPDTSGSHPIGARR